MSDKDIWEAYSDNRRENKHRLTDMYMHVLRENNTYQDDDIPAGYEKITRTDGTVAYISQNILNTHARLDAHGTSVYDKVIEVLKSKHYTEESFSNGHFAGLVQQIIRDGQGQAFLDYATSESKPRLLDDNNLVGNLLSQASQRNYPVEALTRLMDAKWTDSGGSNIGPGEIALALTFSDVSNKYQTKGDDVGGDLLLTIGGQDAIGGFDGIPLEDDESIDFQQQYDHALEIKGQGGRFGQQSGRGGVASNAVDNIYATIFEPMGVEFAELGNSQNLVPLLMTMWNKAGAKQNELKKAITEQMLQTAYPYGVQQYPKVFAALKANDGAKLKRAIISVYTYSYLDNPKHNYTYLLFAQKTTPFPYALLVKGKNLDDAIDSDMLYTTAGWSEKTQRFSKTSATTGFSTSDWYPTMQYRFGALN